MNTLLKSFIILPLLFICNTGLSQETESLDQQTKKAYALLSKGSFGAALPLWKQIVKQDSTNANVNFKIGLCYFNSWDEQAKALPYFKKAVKAMTPKYNFFSAKEKKSPYDALYFLAETFKLCNEIDSALNYFVLYNDQFSGEPPMDVYKQIISCVNAKNYVNSPRNVKLINLGKPVNSQYSEMNPVVTIDNSIVFFSSRRLRADSSNKNFIDKVTGKYFEDIYFSKKDEKGKWSTPQLFKYSTPDHNEAPLCLSSDGLTLFFRKEVEGNSSIYQSIFKQSVWEEPQMMGSNINSLFNETGASISADGKYLYFSSNREGGEGEYDIYQCVRKANGKWGQAKNLGKIVNTASSEISPFIHPDGKTLFFSCNGKGMGGYDIYFTELQSNNTWSKPQNLGYPINSTRDDINYYLSSGGVRYCSSINKDSSYDIYEIIGGGLDVEAIAAGKEVVKLTTEMNVAEVVEVEKIKEKEVEVVEVVETEKIVNKEVEVVEAVDLGGNGTNKDSTKVEETAAEAQAEADSVAAAKAAAATEVAKAEESKVSLLDTINMETLDKTARTALVEKVRNYLTKQVTTGQATGSKTIYFNFNSCNLSRKDKSELTSILTSIKENPTAKVEIVGYTDNKGTWDMNLRISESRAKSIFDFLIENQVPKNKMIYYGKGDSSPIASNDDKEGCKLNRRVEVTLLK